MTKSKPTQDGPAPQTKPAQPAPPAPRPSAGAGDATSKPDPLNVPAAPYGMSTHSDKRPMETRIKKD